MKKHRLHRNQHKPHHNPSRPTCQKCGRLLIAPLSGGYSNYCWHCDIEYFPDIVKPYREKTDEENKVGEVQKGQQGSHG